MKNNLKKHLIIIDDPLRIDPDVASQDNEESVVYEINNKGFCDIFQTAKILKKEEEDREKAEKQAWRRSERHRYNQKKGRKNWK